MSRGFDHNSSEYLDQANVPVSSMPFTMSCRFFCPTDAQQGSELQWDLMTFSDASQNDNWSGLYLTNASHPSPNKLLCSMDGESGSTGTATSTGTWSTSIWHHAACVFTSTTSRAVFLDGAKDTNGTTVVAPTFGLLDKYTIGEWVRTPNLVRYFNGHIAEVAVWDVALTDEEITALSKGISPLLIRPDNLVSYVPLVRDEDEDIITGNTFTANGTPTIETHAPTSYPDGGEQSPAQIIASTPPVTMDSTANAGATMTVQDVTQLITMDSTAAGTTSATSEAGQGIVEMDSTAAGKTTATVSTVDVTLTLSSTAAGLTTATVETEPLMSSTAAGLTTATAIDPSQDVAMDSTAAGTTTATAIDANLQLFQNDHFRVVLRELGQLLDEIPRTSPYTLDLDALSLPDGFWSIDIIFRDQFGTDSLKCTVDVDVSSGSVRHRLREVVRVEGIPKSGGDVEIRAALEIVQDSQRDNPATIEFADQSDLATIIGTATFAARQAVFKITKNYDDGMLVRPAARSKDSLGRVSPWIFGDAVAADDMAPATPVLV